MDRPSPMLSKDTENDVNGLSLGWSAVFHWFLARKFLILEFSLEINCRNCRHLPQGGMDGGRDISWITMGMHQPIEATRTGLQPARPQTARKLGSGSGGGLDARGSRPGTARKQRPMSARPAISVTDSAPWGESGKNAKLSLLSCRALKQ